MIKSVILPDDLKDDAWNFPQSEDRYVCYDCGSLLFYIKHVMAVVHEVMEMGIAGYKDHNQLSLRECGFKVYCAECGNFQEIYFYQKDNIVCNFEDLDYAEAEEIQYCLSQYNQKKKYTPRYKSTAVLILQKKIEEYEKAHQKEIKKGMEK